MIKRILFILIIVTLSLSAKTYILSTGSKNAIQTYAHKILEIAYTRADLKMQAKFLQHAKSLEYSNAGKTDGELVRIKKITKMYTNLRIIPVHLFSIHAIAFSVNKNIHINEWSDLKNYNFTITRGVKFIENPTKNMKKNVVDTYEKAFIDLLNKKTDIVVVPRLSGLNIIYNKGYVNIKAVSSSLKSLELYHFVHKKNADIIPLLTPILQKMKDTGELSYRYSAHLRSITPEKIK